MANPELVRKLDPDTKVAILVAEGQLGRLSTSELSDLVDLLAADPADRAAITQGTLGKLVVEGMPAGRVEDLRKAFATGSGASMPTPAAPTPTPPPSPPSPPGPPGSPAVPTSQAAADALARSASSQQTRPVQPPFKVPFENEPSVTTKAEEAETTESAIMEWSDLQDALQKAAKSEPPPPEPPPPPEEPEPPEEQKPATPQPPAALKAPLPLRGKAAQIMSQGAAGAPPPAHRRPTQMQRPRSSAEPIMRRDTLHFGSAPSGMGPGRADAGRPVVLVADDDNRIRMVFRIKLEQKGFRVIESENGADAWKRLQQGGISALVLDMKMPGLHGLEVLQRLSDHKQELPVVVCTAYDRLDDEFVVATYPKLRYLTKPVDPDHLADTLVNLLAEETG